MTTHADLVTAAERWLRRKCPIVLVDVHSATSSEQPDAIGWTNSGFATLVECKASRTDFHRDARKWFRRLPSRGVGHRRYFMAPDGLLEGLLLPDGWGLLYATSRGVRMVRGSDNFYERNHVAESALLVGALRRATEGWGRRTFGEVAPPLAPDGDPHPSASKVIRDLRHRVAELERLAYMGDHRFPDATDKSRLEETVDDLRRAQFAAAAAFGDLREIASACGQRDDECYRQAIERRLAELTAKANELPGLTATLDEFGHAIGLVRAWLERFSICLPLDARFEIASILDPLPRFPSSRDEDAR